MQNCFYTCLKQGCKVSGPDSDIKWVIGLLSGVVETANKTPILSSVFMHMGHKKFGNYYYLCVKDACKVLRHNSISKEAVGAATIIQQKQAK